MGRKYIIEAGQVILDNPPKWKHLCIIYVFLNSHLNLPYQYLSTEEKTGVSIKRCLVSTNPWSRLVFILSLFLYGMVFHSLLVIGLSYMERPTLGVTLKLIKVAGSGRLLFPLTKA